VISLSLNRDPVGGATRPPLGCGKTGNIGRTLSTQQQSCHESNRDANEGIVRVLPSDGGSPWIGACPRAFTTFPKGSAAAVGC